MIIPFALGLVALLSAPTVDRLGYRLAGADERPLSDDPLTDMAPVFPWLAGIRDAAKRAASLRRAAVEFGVVATALLSYFAFDGVKMYLALWLLLFGSVVAMTDLTDFILPNVVTYPAAAVTLLGLTAYTYTTGEWWSLLTAVLGGLGWALLIIVIILIKPGSMGLGDAKLALSVGQIIGYFGLWHWATGWASSYFIQMFAVIWVLARRGVSKDTIKNTALPYGPYMIAGTFVGLLVGEQVDAYILF